MGVSRILKLFFEQICVWGREAMNRKDLRSDNHLNSETETEHENVRIAALGQTQPLFPYRVSKYS